MKKREKLKSAERLEISILLGKGYSLREIAGALNRVPNTISYEIKNNSVNGIYDPIKAQNKARLKLRQRRFQWKKIEEDIKLKQYVIESLKNHWNPDEISGRMERERKPFYVSKTAIYEWLRSNRGQYWCRYLYSKRCYKKKRKKNKTERVMIPERVSIDKRFLGADNRTRYGHWEIDALVSGKKGRGALAVMNERKSRLLVARKSWSLSSNLYIGVVQKMFLGLNVKSATFDNGIENKNHRELESPTFFCEPYRSWEKGGVENANKMIRRYIPKGTNISKVPDWYVNRVVSIINNKPRKVLHYQTALEVATAAGVLLNQQTSVS